MPNWKMWCLLWKERQVSMKRYLLLKAILFIFFNYFSSEAQSISVKIHKNELEVGEVIMLKYISDVKIDSVTRKKFKGFSIQKTNTVTNTYFSDGKRGVRYMTLFSIKSLELGAHKIYSPSFHYKGNVLKSKTIQIKVKGEGEGEGEVIERPVSKTIKSVEKPR